MNLQPQTVYVPVDRKTDLLIAFRERVSNNQTSLATLQSNIEKREGVIVLAPKELEKIKLEEYQRGRIAGWKNGFQFTNSNT